MPDFVKRFTRAALAGAGNISLYRRRDYARYIPASPRAASEERWARLGARLRNAAEKVVGHHGEVQ